MSETTCERVEGRITELVEGAPAAELEAHLDRCDACAAAVTRARRTTRMVAGLGDGFVLPDDLVQRVMVAADELTGPPPERGRPLPALASLWRSWPARAAALAAGLGLVVWGAATISSEQKPAATPTPTPAPVWGQVLALEATAGQTPRATHGGRVVATGARVNLRRPLSTGDRTRTRLRLADGSELMLNRRTTLVARSANELHLRRGELLADVRPRRAGHALIIRVPTGAIRVLGTKFNLAAHKDLALVDVIHGAVRMIGARDRAALVGAGEEGALPHRGAPSVSRAPDLGRTLSWAASRQEEMRSLAGLGSLSASRPGQPKKRRPLRLASHEVSVRVQENLARTQITETFENPTGHTLEGVYRFPLPAGARISRLALYVDDRLEEGTVVERGRANKIWRGVIRQATPSRLRKRREEFIWVPGPWKDPALLQWRQGNQFELRIYPIPARGKRTVILSYTEILAPTARGRRYVYPLPDGRNSQVRVGRFSLDLDLRGHDPLAPVWTPGSTMKVTPRGDAHRVTFAARDFAPAGDLVVDFATRAAAAPLRITTFRPPGSTAHGYALLALRPRLPGHGSRRARDVVLVVDRSHSALGEVSRRQRRLLQALVADMDGKDRVRVLACRASCDAVGPWEQASPSAARRLAKALARWKAEGATDLGEAARRAGQVLGGRGAATGRLARVIYLGDGVPSVGELEAGRLAALVRRHLGPHRARLTTVGVGTSVDAAVLTTMARAGQGSHVAYTPGTTARGQALAVLSRQYGVVLDQVVVSLPQGLSSVAPSRVPSLFQGEELLMAARASGPIRGSVKISGRVNGEPYSRTYRVDAAIRGSEGNAFVPRLWAWLTVQDLQARPDPVGAHRRTVVRLSKAHHLLTRHTSLLVLESEAMRRAFGVDRGQRARAWSGLEARRDDHQMVARSGVLGLLGSSGGGGGLGLKGFGRGGGSVGRGTIGMGSGRGKAPRLPGEVIPRIPARASAVMGAMDKNVIRRVARSHINQVRAVYQRALKRNPSVFNGRLNVSFVIGATGHVTSARVRGGASGTQLARDLERVVRSWRFPAPRGGGSVSVTYPFFFRSAGNGAKAAPAAGARPPSTPPPATAQAQTPRPPRRPGTAPLPGDPLGGRRRGPGRWVRARRIWVQQAELRRLGGASARDLRLVARRRQELARAPLSRDRHQRLYAVLARSGRGAEAMDVLEAWLRKDPRSPEALELLAEAAARLGQRQRAMRALGSLLDQTPANTALHRRMVAMHQAAGNTRLACAHRLSLGTLIPLHSRALAEAQDCREGFAPRPSSRPVRGRVSLRARWQGDLDLDLALVTPRGRRISWLANRRRLSFAHVTDAGREELAVSWLPAGRYRVEVVAAKGAAALPASGVLRVRAPGLNRRLRFTLTRGQTYVAELRIRSHSRLVQAR